MSSGSKVSFSTNDPINMTLYKNIVSYGNAQRGTMVRLSLSGKDAASGNASRYIAEGGTGISDSVTYRVLATICRRDEQKVPDDTWIGMTCNFSNVNVDGINVSWDGNVEAYMSTVTRKSTGILEGKINMD